MASRDYDLTNPKETEQWLKDVETEYKFQCLDYKEPDGCHRLAEFMREIRNNIPAALKLWKENCDNNSYPDSCYKYGLQCYNGKHIPKVKSKPDKELALKYFEKSCEKNFMDGCHAAGIARLDLAAGDPTKTAEAAAFLDKGCKLKNGNACFVLSNIYLKGEGVPKDLTKAFALSARGCDLDFFPSCHNLSVMYQNGHGCEKNEKLSLEAKKKAMTYELAKRQRVPNVRVNE